MGWNGWASPRLFTLAQGQTEVHFPDGFGLPVRSDEALSASTQVLNAYDEYIGSEVRQKITIKYIKESERTEQIRGLRLRFTQAVVSLDEAPRYFSMASHDHMEMVITGARTEGMTQLNKGEAAGFVIKDGLGRETAAHWIVPPGYDENHTVMNRLMGLHQDVEIHFIAGHLHPYAKSIVIHDMTNDRLVFSTDIESSADQKVLTKIGNFSSAGDPIMLYADHDYELVTVYNNTTDSDVTAMAVLNMYVLDTEFDADANGWRR